jgi:hypothetical protein
LLSSPGASFQKKTKHCIFERENEFKTPGLSFSKKRLCFLSELLTLSQKKVQNLDLDFVQKKIQSSEETSSIHKVSQSEQVILFDALSHDQLLTSQL